MTKDNQFCCLHVKKCAMVIAIIGLVGSIFSLCTAFVVWFYVPLSVVLIVVYILVMVGIYKERPSYLLPAQIILAINIILNILCAIFLFVMAIIIPDNWVPDDKETDFKTAKKALRAELIVMGVIVIFATIYGIFALKVIHRARKYLICHLNSCQP